MLPISAADLIEFRPAAERVTAAQVALAGAQAADTPNPVTLQSAETALAEAEAAQAADDPVYRLRVPTERSRAGVNRDVIAEGLLLKGNTELIDAILASTDEISPDDAAFAQGVKQAMKDSDTIPDGDWPRIHLIARTIPAAARIIADRLMYSTMTRIHSIRHHLVIEGQRTPLPERVLDDLARNNPDDVAAIGAKIDSLLTVDRDTAKN